MRDDRPENIIGRKPVVTDARTIRAIRADLAERKRLHHAARELSDKNIARKYNVPMATVKGVHGGIYKWVRASAPNSSSTGEKQ